MKKIVVFGNSGSGKSTLAHEISEADDIGHLDLDSVAWKPSNPPERRPIPESKEEIEKFISSNVNWVIEGCYSDLLKIVIPSASEIIFLDLPESECISNAMNRPWEPHKYATKEAQDENLSMLIDWISQYSKRKGMFSKESHQALFDGYAGKKTRYTSNERRR